MADAAKKESRTTLQRRRRTHGVFLLKDIRIEYVGLIKIAPDDVIAALKKPGKDCSDAEWRAQTDVVHQYVQRLINNLTNLEFDISDQGLKKYDQERNGSNANTAKEFTGED